MISIDNIKEKDLIYILDTNYANPKVRRTMVKEIIMDKIKKCIMGFIIVDFDKYEEGYTNEFLSYKEIYFHIDNFFYDGNEAKEELKYLLECRDKKIIKYISPSGLYIRFSFEDNVFHISDKKRNNGIFKEKLNELGINGNNLRIIATKNNGKYLRCTPNAYTTFFEVYIDTLEDAISIVDKIESLALLKKFI